jgi:hypothetical protein
MKHPFQGSQLRVSHRLSQWGRVKVPDAQPAPQTVRGSMLKRARWPVRYVEPCVTKRSGRDPGVCVHTG